MPHKDGHHLLHHWNSELCADIFFCQGEFSPLDTLALFQSVPDEHGDAAGRHFEVVKRLDAILAGFSQESGERIPVETRPIPDSAESDVVLLHGSLLWSAGGKLAADAELQGEATEVFRIGAF